jgi:hypothetical protein
MEGLICSNMSVLSQATDKVGVRTVHGNTQWLRILRTVLLLLLLLLLLVLLPRPSSNHPNALSIVLAVVYHPIASTNAKCLCIDWSRRAANLTGCRHVKANIGLAS